MYVATAELYGGWYVPRGYIFTFLPMRIPSPISMILHYEWKYSAGFHIRQGSDKRVSLCSSVSVMLALSKVRLALVRSTTQCFLSLPTVHSFYGPEGQGSLYRTYPFSLKTDNKFFTVVDKSDCWQRQSYTNEDMFMNVEIVFSS